MRITTNTYQLLVFCLLVWFQTRACFCFTCIELFTLSSSPKSLCCIPLLWTRMQGRGASRVRSTLVCCCSMPVQVVHIAGIVCPAWTLNLPSLLQVWSQELLKGKVGNRKAFLTAVSSLSFIHSLSFLN